jgi:hypothetical protein
MQFMDIKLAILDIKILITELCAVVLTTQSV